MSSHYAFQIGVLNNWICRHFASNKRYLIVTCVLLFAIVLFFSVDSGRMFRSVPSVRMGFHAEWMRESELQALYLLKNQQLELLNLWNRTISHNNLRSWNPGPIPASNLTDSTSNSSNLMPMRDEASSPAALSFEEFRYALLQQIKLSKEIQETLVSSHRLGNASVATNGNGDATFLGSGTEICRKADQIVHNGTIEWKPKSDRYLFAICFSGQMSNHLICLEKHMVMAALLDRVLVFPSSKIDYDYDQVIDFQHINDCFGRKVAISFDEFATLKRKRLHIDRLICYVPSPPCYVDGHHMKRLKSLGVSIGKIEVAWPNDTKADKLKHTSVGDILQKFSSSNEVIAVGEMFFANVAIEWLKQPGAPVDSKCKTVIQPSRLIILTAQRFIQTFLGGNFIALHFRRHDFLQFCNLKEESCFFPIPQAAKCIIRAVERANALVIYLSTDAAESEIDLLQSMIMVDGRQIPLVKRASHNSVEKWDALLYRNHLGGDGQVEAMLDKTICAMSHVFIGSSGSAFTEGIFHLRKGWGIASVCDEHMCEGEQPNFIADIM